MFSPARALIRLTLYFLWTLLVVPPYALCIGLGTNAHRWVPSLYWRGAARLLGFEIAVRGRPCRDRPLLFVVNHASYLDIVILGSLLNAIFVAKSEVSGWPGIGLLARLARTIFIERRAARSAAQRDVVGERLERGEPVILFPEGTSSDGNRVLPFKSALFSVAEKPVAGRPVMVQPVSMAYTKLDGMPLGVCWRPFVAWYGDMELAPHLWAVLGMGRLRVEVEFHAPVSFAAFGSRKAMADHCRKVVARGVSQALAGRDGTGEAGAGAVQTAIVSAG